MVRDARARIREVGPAEARERLDAGCTFLDVREADEVRHGVVPGALWLPLAEVPARVREVVPVGAEVVVVCARGNRSALAALVMQDLGYRDVASLSTGMAGWLASGLPVGAPGAAARPGPAGARGDGPAR
jgi:rhodanese-related sulfurtransferase